MLPYSRPGTNPINLDDAMFIAMNKVTHDLLGYLMCTLIIADIGSGAKVEKADGATKVVITDKMIMKRALPPRDCMAIILCVQSKAADEAQLFDDFWDAEINTFFVFVPHGTNINTGYVDDVLKGKILGSVPEHTITPMASREEIESEIEKFISHIKSTRTVGGNRKKIEDSAAIVEAAILEKIDGKATAIRDRIRLAMNGKHAEIAKVAVSEEDILSMSYSIEPFASAMRTISGAFGDKPYPLNDMENLAWIISQPTKSMSHPKEKLWNKYGVTFKWGEDDDGVAKFTKTQIRASRLAFDFLWAISPAQRPKSLIMPDQSSSHARLIEVFGEHMRMASVMFGALCFSSCWGAEMRLKASIDSRAAAIIRSIISDALSAIPIDDPLKCHLMDERVPDTEKLKISDIIKSMTAWTNALLMAYAQHYVPLNEVIVDLQNRPADGQKEKWDAKIIDKCPDSAFIRDVDPTDFGVLLADYAKFDKFAVFGGTPINALHVILKPCKISYDDRLYSMGRYEMFVTYNKDKDSIEVDFVTEGLSRNIFNRQPMFTFHTDGLSYMHSHIQSRVRESADDDPSRVICFGNLNGRYCRNTQIGRTPISEVKFDVSDCFDGSPNSIPIYGVNVHDLINTMFHLTLSCYRHTDGHAAMNMTNWTARRVH